MPAAHTVEAHQMKDPSRVPGMQRKADIDDNKRHHLPVLEAGLVQTFNILRT